jgi:hypothetical protein
MARSCYILADYDAFSACHSRIEPVRERSASESIELPTARATEPPSRQHEWKAADGLRFYVLLVGTKQQSWLTEAVTQPPASESKQVVATEQACCHIATD